jgi:prepilin-type N-terminal cleavage/methylation domain-containing protein
VAGHGRGYTLMELMVAVTIAGIMMSLAVPRMEAMIRREQVRGAANRLAADLAYARLMAMRNGSSTVVRFTADARCPGRGGASGYSIGMRGRAPPLRRVHPEAGTLVCFESTGSDSMVYTSRGLLAPFNNRTIRVALGDVRDSLTVTVAGRILVRR